MTTTTATAQQIANELGDGMTFQTKDGRSLHSMAREAHAYVERAGASDTYRYDFADGSSITVAGGAWDLGYRDCFCWRGAGHTEECLERQAERA
jgi:hypothetical protein